MAAAVTGDAGRPRRLFVGGLAAVTFVVVGLSAAGGSVRPIGQTDGGRFGQVPQYRRPQIANEAGRQVDQPPESAETLLSDVVSVLLQTLAIVAAGLLLVALVRAIRWAIRAIDVSRPNAVAPPEEPPVHGAMELREAVEGSIARLDGGPVEDVIIACWVRLEEAAAAAGVVRNPSETPSELTVRVLQRGGVPSVAVERLLTLYRAARYSRHHLGEAARAQAQAALREIRAGLIAAAPA